MASILLYTASITQTGSNAPTVSVGLDKFETSGSWSRIGTGSFKFTRGSGSFFTPVSGSTISSSIFGVLNISYYSSTTSSFSIFLSGSDSSSLYLNTFTSDNTFRLVDNALSGSANKVNLSVSILY
jgi:hypothetical protein